MGLLENLKEKKMSLLENKDDLKELVEKLNFKEKVERSKAIIREAYEKYGDSLVVANSLGKDSVAVWDLAKRVNPKIRGFVVTTRYKPKETVAFMNEEVARYPELKVYKSDVDIPSNLYKVAPDQCCDILKVEPVKRAIEEMKGIRD
jgi:phosphoadenosine phosphosulfate reductase